MKSELPFVSIITPSYNQGRFIEHTIQSVLNQTYKPFEVIVCDDASSDGSRELIKDYEKKYSGLVTAILHQENLGISKNRNSGLEACSGDLVTWVDGDDIFMPKKLEFEMKNYLADNDVKWVYSQVIIMDENGNELHSRYKESHAGWIFDKVVSMMGEEPKSPLVDLKSLQKISFFKEDLDLYEDFDLCLRLAKFYKCSYCPEPMMGYRIHQGGVHKSPIEHHLTNFKKIHKNLKNLLEDAHRKRSWQLQRRYLGQQNLILTRGYFNAGRKLRTLFFLFQCLIFNPKAIMFTSKYFNFKPLIKAGLAALGYDIHRIKEKESTSPLLNSMYKIRSSMEEVLEHCKALGFSPGSVIDVGVASGTPALYTRFPNARHLLIEPLMEFEHSLKDISNAFNAEYVLAAASASSGKMEIFVSPTLTASSLLGPKSKNNTARREVPVVTLDGVCKERGFTGPYLLKVDVQGAELHVLDGATEVLSETEMVILEVSFFHSQDDVPEFYEVIHYMMHRGFVVYEIFGGHNRPLDGARAQVDVAFVKENGVLRKSHD